MRITLSLLLLQLHGMAGINILQSVMYGLLTNQTCFQLKLSTIWVWMPLRTMNTEENDDLLPFLHEFYFSIYCTRNTYFSQWTVHLINLIRGTQNNVFFLYIYLYTLYTTNIYSTFFFVKFWCPKRLPFRARRM